MPVQIDEVIITTTVNPQASTPGGNQASEPSDPVVDERELANKILQIIREKSER
jgi:hypothetical protein